MLGPSGWALWALLDGKRHRRAVLDGRHDLRPETLVGVLLDDDDLVGVVVEVEDVGRLAGAHLVPLAQPEVSDDLHCCRRLYLARQGRCSWITIFE